MMYHHVCISMDVYPGKYPNVVAWSLYLLDDTPMGGSPRPMEPMGPHRPRALKYTPTGGSSRPIGQGPSAKAHGAHGAPYGPMGPIWAQWAPYGPNGAPYIKIYPKYIKL